MANIMIRKFFKKLFCRIFHIDNSKIPCAYCGRAFKESDLVPFADNWYCSEFCMCKDFGRMTTKELLKLDSIDKEKRTFK